MDSIKCIKGQKYVFLNVRSLYCHLSEITQEFSASEFMCIGLTESWLNCGILNKLIEIRGYKIAILNRSSGKRGGLILYIRNDLNWEPVDGNLNVINDDIEILNVIVHRKFTKPLHISLTYLPPTGSVLNAISQLDRISESLVDKNIDWLLAGDFNIDLLSKKIKGMYIDYQILLNVVH